MLTQRKLIMSGVELTTALSAARFNWGLARAVELTATGTWNIHGRCAEPKRSNIILKRWATKWRSASNPATRIAIDGQEVHASLPAQVRNMFEAMVPLG